MRDFARQGFSFASSRHLDFLDCETETSKGFECEMTLRHLRIKNETARRT